MSAVDKKLVREMTDALEALVSVGHAERGEGGTYRLTDAGRDAIEAALAKAARPLSTAQCRTMTYLAELIEKHGEPLRVWVGVKPYSRQTMESLQRGGFITVHPRQGRTTWDLDVSITAAGRAALAKATGN